MGISCMLQVLFLTGCQMDVVGDKSKEPSARGWPSWVPPIVQTLQPIVINVGPNPTPQPTPAPPPPMVVGTLTDPVGSAVSSAKQGFKRILNNIKEDLEKVEIQIELVGYKFKGEHFEVRVVDENLLDIKAEGNDQKYHKQFKLASNAIIEKIESKFECNEEDKQTLTIKVPKNVKIFQVPIAWEEQN